MVRRSFPAVAMLAAALAVSGCSTMDSLNPFASKGPKIAELTPFKASVETRVTWRESVGKSDVYVFTPAVVGRVAYAASRDGTIVRKKKKKWPSMIRIWSG